MRSVNQSKISISLFQPIISEYYLCVYTRVARSGTAHAPADDTNTLHHTLSIGTGEWSTRVTLTRVLASLRQTCADHGVQDGVGAGVGPEIILRLIRVKIFFTYSLQSSSETTGTSTLWSLLGRPNPPSCNQNYWTWWWWREWPTLRVPHPVTVHMVPASVSCSIWGRARGWTQSVNSRDSDDEILNNNLLMIK